MPAKAHRAKSGFAAWLIALSLPILLASEARAQSAEKIIDLHIKAMGGAKALKAVASLRLRGTVGDDGEFLWVTKAPSGHYLELRRGGSHELEAFNGKSAWREDEAAGAHTLTGREQARARATALYRNDHFLTYRKDKMRVRALGRQTVEGRAAQAVELTTAAGLRRTVFFDAQTYLILKEEQEREGGSEELFFGDYRSVDGVQEPQHIRLCRGGETLELAVREAEHNVRVEAALFDFPRSGAPLPEFAALVKDVIGNQDALEKARESYTYSKTENEIELDDKGRIREKHERSFHVFYVAGSEIEKLVTKDGRPLTEAEARKEQERVDKAIRDGRERKRRSAEKKAQQERRQAEKKGDRKDEDKDELTISEILRVCQFVNPRRERFRGREVLVYEFEPRAGVQPRNRGESWARKLSGNVWIDEQAKEIVRAEGRLTEGIKMAGGLVLSLQRGATFVLEQELVNGEVWLPSYAEVNAAGRILLVKGFKVNQTQRFSDYKKFEVETSSEIELPNR